MCVAAPPTNADVVSLEPGELALRGISRTEIGQLNLPTGEIIACDPLVTRPGWPSLARKVRPGSYSVSLYEAHGRVALAALRFAPGKPAKWEIAIVPGQDPVTLNADEIFGYPVDAGLGSFMDQTAMVLMDAERDKLGPEKNYYDDVLAAEFAPHGDRFVMHQPAEGNLVNIAMFWSGWGDGFYASYWVWMPPVSR